MSYFQVILANFVIFRDHYAMTISQQTLRKERSFSVFFITYFVVISTKTNTSLVSTYLYPRMIKLRRKSYNLSQKSLFWTSKQPFAIRSFLASYNVCPVANPELFAQKQVSDSWQLTYCLRDGSASRQNGRILRTFNSRILRTFNSRILRTINGRFLRI